MKEILPHMFDNIRNEMIILAIIFVAAIVIWFIGNQIDIVNGIYEAIRETINNEDHPRSSFDPFVNKTENLKRKTFGVHKRSLF